MDTWDTLNTSKTLFSESLSDELKNWMNDFEIVRFLFYEI